MSVYLYECLGDCVLVRVYDIMCVCECVSVEECLCEYEYLYEYTSQGVLV